MLGIPLYVFLFLYIIFVAVFFGFLLVNVYHIVMSGSFTLPSFFMTFFIFATSVLVLYFTIEIINSAAINWRELFPLFKIEWISGTFGNDPFN